MSVGKSDYYLTFTGKNAKERFISLISGSQLYYEFSLHSHSQMTFSDHNVLYENKNVCILNSCSKQSIM